MPGRRLRALNLSFAFLFGAAASLGAQEAPSTAPGSGNLSPDTGTASAADSQASSPSPLAGLKLIASAEASYAYSTRAVGAAIVGRLYDRFSNQFTLNAVNLAVERPFETGKWDAGVRVDLSVGQNAAVLQSSGLNLGPNADLTQLYVVLNVPTSNGNGVQFKLGKIATLMGLELIDVVLNPNWSEGNQFVYVENFTATGLEMNYNLSSQADVQLRVSNGWDRVAPASMQKDFMGRIGIRPAASTSLGLLVCYGAQQTDSDAKRFGAEALINQKAGPASVWVQVDYGREEANPALPDPTQDAAWWAGGVWLAYDLKPKLGFAVRADYLDDRQGFRTSASFALPAGGPRHRLWSATGTLNIRSWPGVLVRPEIRYDHSSLTPFLDRHSQLTVALSVAYVL